MDARNYFHSESKDPRIHFYQQRKQRLNNKSFRSDQLSQTLLTHLGGPLNSQPKNLLPHNSTNNNLFNNNNKNNQLIQNTTNSNPQSRRQKQSALQQYASLLLSQRQCERHKSMLKKDRYQNYQQEKDRKYNLDLLDKDRYYFKRAGFVDHKELVQRNSMAEFIRDKPISHDNVYGRHTVIPVYDKKPYLGYGNFTPKMLNNADEVKNIIFGI